MIKLYKERRNGTYRLENEHGSYTAFQTLPDLYHRKKHVWTLGISAAERSEQFEFLGEFENATALFREHKLKYPEEYI